MDSIKKTAPVVFIVDMDGFMSQKKFLCKELAYIDVLSHETYSFYFQVGRYTDLTQSDRITANYCIKNIHGLAFHDAPLDWPQTKVDDIFMFLSSEAMRRSINGNGLVAFKGGHVELDVFRRLGLQNYCNLEQLGCPKFSNIIETFPFKYTNTMCSRHIRLTHNTHNLHCPRCEVEGFALWARHCLNIDIK